MNHNLHWPVVNMIRVFENNATESNSYFGCRILILQDYVTEKNKNQFQKSPKNFFLLMQVIVEFKHLI